MLNKNLQWILKSFLNHFHNQKKKCWGWTRNNKVPCWFFLSTKYVKNMPKRKSTQKTVAFSCFPQKSVLEANRWKPYWMKLETVNFSKTISAEWQIEHGNLRSSSGGYFSDFWKTKLVRSFLKNYGSYEKSKSIYRGCQITSPPPRFDVSNKNFHGSKISYTGRRVQQTSLKPRGGGSNLTPTVKVSFGSI